MKILAAEPKLNSDLLANMNKLFNEKNYTDVVKMFEKRLKNLTTTQNEISEAHLILYANSLKNIVSSYFVFVFLLILSLKSLI